MRFPVNYSKVEGFTHDDLVILQQYNTKMRELSEKQEAQLKYERGNPGDGIYYEPTIFNKKTEEVATDDFNQRMDYQVQLQFAAVVTGISAILLAVMFMSN